MGDRSWGMIKFGGDIPLDAISEIELLSLNGKNRFSNTYWGVGFLAGFQPTFNLCYGFQLFANIDASLIWGKLDLDISVGSFMPSSVFIRSLPFRELRLCLAFILLRN